MDPRQRMSLEVPWEALENVGIDPKSLSGSDAAVLLGVLALAITANYCSKTCPIFRL